METSRSYRLNYFSMKTLQQTRLFAREGLCILQIIVFGKLNLDPIIFLNGVAFIGVMFELVSAVCHF